MIDGTITTIAVNLVATISQTMYGLSSDLVTDRDRLTPGNLYYSIAWAYTGKRLGVDSNVAYFGYELTIWIRHRLSNPNQEYVYLGISPYWAELLLRALGDRNFYLLGAPLMGINPDIYALEGGDSAIVLTAPEREGNVISFSARVKLLLNS